jgi:hypothetical protein
MNYTFCFEKKINIVFTRNFLNRSFFGFVVLPHPSALCRLVAKASTRFEGVVFSRGEIKRESDSQGLALRHIIQSLELKGSQRCNG